MAAISDHGHSLKIDINNMLFGLRIYIYISHTHAIVDINKHMQLISRAQSGLSVWYNILYN